jgi:cyclopropane-fatty-acyl-phospholipid synthase
MPRPPEFPTVSCFASWTIANSPDSLTGWSRSAFGAYVPALSETFAATERCGLWCDDMEVLRLHYRYTVKHWRERFAKNRARAAAIYDERFSRMWEFYLAAVELEFRHGSHMVFQMLLSTKRDAVPITRDFMVDSERAAWARTAG